MFYKFVGRQRIFPGTNRTLELLCEIDIEEMSGNESEFESLLSNSLVSASERLGSCWLFYLTEISAKHGAPCRPQGAGSDPRPRTVSVSEGRNACRKVILRQL